MSIFPGCLSPLINNIRSGVHNTTWCQCFGDLDRYGLSQRGVMKFIGMCIYFSYDKCKGLNQVQKPVWYFRLGFFLVILSTQFYFCLFTWQCHSVALMDL